MERILIACCTLRSIDLRPYIDHTRMWYDVGKNYSNIEFIQMCSQRMSIDRFRNEVMKLALGHNMDYIFFIDDDMLIPKDTFKLLYEARSYDIISALNYIRGYPFKIMSFKWDLLNGKYRRLINITEQDLPNPLGSPIPVAAIGTAVCLIKVEPFKKVPSPWFLTGPHGTEDIYMCLKAKDYVPYIKIGTHTGIITGHTLEPEVISHDTRAAHMSYIESFMSPDEIQKHRSENVALAQVPNRENGFRKELTYEELMGKEMAVGI